MVPVLALMLLAGVAYVLYISIQPDRQGPDEPPPTEAELMQARLDLLRIEKGVDIALLQQEQHQEAERVKAAIKEALEAER